MFYYSRPLGFRLAVIISSLFSFNYFYQQIKQKTDSENKVIKIYTTHTYVPVLDFIYYLFPVCHALMTYIAYDYTLLNKKSLGPLVIATSNTLAFLLCLSTTIMSVSDLGSGIYYILYLISISAAVFQYSFIQPLVGFFDQPILPSVLGIYCAGFVPS